MKLTKYFRQLKRFIVLPKQFKYQGIKNPLFYSYYHKIFFNFMIQGLFKNQIKINFGNDYWKHVPRYIFSDMPSYFYKFVNYKLNEFNKSCYEDKLRDANLHYIPPLKPTSPKSRMNHKCVNEFVLERVANMLGFEVVSESLESLKSIYILK